jgi:hypothetical protein
MKRFAFGIALLASAICNSAHAQRIGPSSSLAGYQCHHIDAEALKLTPEEAWSGKGFPPVFRKPSAASAQLGVASGVVYVAWPLLKENGFLKILRMDGELGWISQDVVRPLYRDPGSKGGCTLSWRGDRIQFHLDPGAKAWLFPNGDNIPDEKIR